MSSSQPTWLALGDSYTIGEGVEPDQRWPHQLTRVLGYSEPDYVATTGWTTCDLLQALPTYSLNPPYDWVSLLIGVNNQYQGKNISDYREDFEQLLHRAISYTSSPEQVLILSIPDYSVTPFARDKDPQQIRDEIEQYNVINREIAGQEGIPYCDITPLSRKAAGDEQWLVEDGLHYSGHMYHRWVQKIVRDVFS